MAASDGALFGIGDSVELVVNILEQMDEETTGTEQSLQTLQITDIAFSSESQTYLFKARFSDEVTLGMEDGVAVTFSSAIIQRSVGRDTALENAFANTEYVIASDRELHDGMVVRLK